IDEMTTAFAVALPTPSAPALVTYPSNVQRYAIAAPNNVALIRLYVTWKLAKPSLTPSMNWDICTSVTSTAAIIPENTPITSANTTRIGSITIAAMMRGTTRYATGSYARGSRLSVCSGSEEHTPPL